MLQADKNIGHARAAGGGSGGRGISRNTTNTYARNLHVLRQKYGRDKCLVRMCVLIVHENVVGAFQLNRNLEVSFNTPQKRVISN